MGCRCIVKMHGSRRLQPAPVAMCRLIGAVLVCFQIFFGSEGMSQDNNKSSIIVDSRMSIAEAIDGTKAPEHVIRELCLVDVLYYSFDGELHQGQLVVHQSVRQEVEEIFALMRSERFPIARAVPIVRYGWSDNASMAANNTSAFNYRRVAGTRRLSRHATGHAVDINPIQNPVIYQDGRISPKDAIYEPGTAGTLSEDGSVVRAFIDRGWCWGRHFKSMMDHHHFQKP
jgi:peptidoglycan L-alanyl-D-glutamate endopeptidase CwlK